MNENPEGGVELARREPSLGLAAVSGAELFGLFNEVAQDTNTWLAAICDELNQPDRRLAFHALRGVLFALRDRLAPEEVLALAVPLPVVVRGMFIEGYDSGAPMPTIHTRDNFLRRVGAEIAQAGNTPAEAATRAVLNVIEEHVSRCGSEHVRKLLQRALHGLWG